MHQIQTDRGIEHLKSAFKDALGLVIRRRFGHNRTASDTYKFKQYSLLNHVIVMRFIYFDIHGNSKPYIEPCLTRGTSTRARLMSVTNRKMRYACKHMGIKLLSFFHAVNADSCHDSNFVVNGGTWFSKPRVVIMAT